MFEMVDHLQRKVKLTNYPLKRIISLVPSQTELLHDLGLEGEVIGITKFCVHPQSWFRNKTRIGGTKNVNIEKVKSLEPDLIIANKEENVKEQIEELEKIAPVWVSDIYNLEDAIDMIESIGVLIDRSQQSKQISQNIQQQFQKLQAENFQLPTAYLIWRNPYMTIGGDTFINDMLKRCGLQNVFEKEQRYPEITLQQLKEHSVQLILLSSEPYPFKEKHVEEIKAVLPAAKILMVDGEMFSWYGSRLLYVVQYFKELINKINEYP
ncbi:ABC transporter substrate-binding protein [Panacibacter ginsenosidivorans]|uniref:ABC transporter substrate-binding protein n=1 Tax=Panacibacter ginsenosidivorans TaxID=1813871 RepID=A0A5B8VDF6_9BACT|nr:helical backbone metal receptor [Panacibacter ginsenosidivorans]QEC69567.1 ABC transporter substrate-binding protein [Panacibacter ginsenosidivorans]